MCVLIFSTNLSEPVLILRRIEQDMIKIYFDFHVKYPLFLSDFSHTWIFLTNFRGILKYQISWKSVQWELSCSMRTDRRTDRHDEANSRFSQILRMPLKRSRLTGSIIDRKGTHQKTRANSEKLRWNSCYTGDCHKQIVPSTWTANVRVCTISKVRNKIAAFASV